MTASPPALVTLGQSLAVVRSGTYGPLSRDGQLRLSVAGAESNVAIGVRRLSFPATWIGHVGADSLGDLLIRELRAENVSVRADRDPSRPTALMLTERRTAGHSRVWYYRRDAAGAGLSASDLPPDLAGLASVIHLTGITPCLGEGPADAVRHAAATARAAGLTVSLDLNHRQALADAPAFAALMRPLVAAADLVFATTAEAAVLTAEENPERMAAALRALGPETVVVKLGPGGSLLASPDGLLRQDAVPAPVVDTMGAGDAFAAGFLAALLGGADPAARMTLAARVAAIAVATQGDWEGLPTEAELAMLDWREEITR
jgi:2-dehydro-3-deoxygluconokinase